MNLYIFFNGPPRAGKDITKRIVRDNFGHINSFITTASDILQESCMAIYGIPKAIWDGRYNGPLKDEPWDELFGISQRQAMIVLAESHLKNLHSDTIMSELFIKRLRGYDDCVGNIFLIDIGFQNEYEFYLKSFGSQNAILVYIHRDGCSYANDSRSTVRPYQDERVFSLVNNGTVHDLIDNTISTLGDTINEFIKKQG